MDHPIDNLVRARLDPAAVEMRADGDDGARTLFGHFATFNDWYEVHSWMEGDFLERFAPGAFARTIAERRDQIKVLYDHGHDPSLGNKPLGPIVELREERAGPYFEVSLIDTDYNRNFVIPAADAGLLGSSFRFKVVAEDWVEPQKATKGNPAKLAERTITDVDLYEFGPVTFPANPGATTGLRCRTDDFAERLLTDPTFVARLTERSGLKVVERILAALPERETPDLVDAAEQRADDPDLPPTEQDDPAARSDDTTDGQPSTPLSWDARKRRARQIRLDHRS